MEMHILGDDDHVQEDDFNAWKEGLWSHLDKLLQTKIDVPPTPGAAYSIAIPEYKLEIHEPGTEMIQRDFNKTFKSFKRNRVIYDAHNLPLDLLFSLHIDDNVENPKNASLHPPFPGPVTLEAELRRYADLLSPPKKSVPRVLVAYASVEEEKARLKLLTSPFGKEEYNDYVVESKETLVEVMSDFPSVKVPSGSSLQWFHLVCSQDSTPLLLHQNSPLTIIAIVYIGKQDFIYEEELNDFVKKGVQSDLSVAFSREGTTKEYVQNKMMQQASAVWEHLSNGGYFSVCGDAKGMAKNVHRTLLTIIQEQYYVDGSKAEAIVKQMENEGRYQRDVW
ncbi:hypothetical protein R1flu_020572 [Riccia fluitans]|uniref:NADPH--hemoprotein reductase n=1 Tax=Riccia fluitans TaxID=41844 RepID=A0ABD1ZQL9_9MARC